MFVQQNEEANFGVRYVWSAVVEHQRNVENFGMMFVVGFCGTGNDPETVKRRKSSGYEGHSF